jgi:hypothetical protein
MGLVASVFSLSEFAAKRRKSPAGMKFAGTTAQPARASARRLVVSMNLIVGRLRPAATSRAVAKQTA